MSNGVHYSFMRKRDCKIIITRNIFLKSLQGNEGMIASERERESKNYYYLQHLPYVIRRYDL